MLLNGKTKVLLFNGHLMIADCRPGHAMTPCLAPSAQPEAPPSWFGVQQLGVACVSSSPGFYAEVYLLNISTQ